MKSVFLSTLIVDVPLKSLASAPKVARLSMELIFSNDSITLRASLSLLAIFNFSTILL